jgi:multidrug efflux pump subunit AcrB
MGIVRLALRRPYTVLVMGLLIAVLGILSVLTMSTDIFPDINVPVISVVWTDVGISPQDMESRVVLVAERIITTTVTGIEHMESQSMSGVGVIKIYFHPDAKIEEALAEVTSIQQTVLRNLPPGITPPLIVRYSASSVPVLQLAIGGKTLSEQKLYDYGQNFFRVELATVQGASVPFPYGGKPRQIMVDINSQALYARALSPSDVVNAVDLQNLFLPSGTVKIAAREYLVQLNGSPDVVSQFNNLPIKTVNGSIIYLRDVAQVHDGYAVQTNIVRENGVRAALVVVLRSAGASTVDIVNRVKARLAQLEPSYPAGLHVEPLFDQSVFVKAAVGGVIKETMIAGCLTALVILLFLGSWRSTLIIVVSIPLAMLCSILVLKATGNTINVMTLGGLSLAVGILVDDATVALENIHRNFSLNGGKPLVKAILDGSQQIALPALVATLSICIVFVSVVFLTGPAKYLFTPMALTVVFAMLASYLLSRTFVPVMAHLLLRPELALHVGAATHQKRATAASQMDGQESRERKKNFIWWIHERFDAQFEQFRSMYVGALAWALGHLCLVATFFVGFFVVSLVLAPFLGRDFFPRVDAGQFRLHVTTRAGTRIEETERVFGQVEDYIHHVIPQEEIKLVLDNIGLPFGGLNFGFVESATIGSTDGEILVSLSDKHHSVWSYEKRLRRELPQKFPGVTFYFQPADIVSQILNFGLPAPLDVQVVGKNSETNYKITQDIARRIREVPGIVDVNVHQLIDAPQFDVNVDRERAQLLGLSENDVANSVLFSLSSSAQVARNYWVNPQNGVQYLVAVQTPQYQVDSLNALNDTPVVAPPSPQSQLLAQQSVAQPQLLANLATIVRATAPVVISHYNIQRTFDVYAEVQDRDLGGVADGVQKIVDQVKSQPDFPKATSIVIRGQAQSMNSAFTTLGMGIAFAVLLVYFLMAVNFQSWIDPLVIISALPGAFAGILWMLFATHTTFNVPSLMGAIMCIGVATSNSILLITFANDQRLKEGKDATEAALAAGATRMRPILMTALAMILGMIPVSLALGEGSEQNAPLARAVIGGLLVATVTTLFFVPVVYSMLRRKPLRPFSAEDASLLFDQDEPERLLAESALERVHAD